MPLPHYHLVVIGSGQAGDPLARAFARAGRTAALIERDHVGGTCANTGCTPTKTMVASARVAYLARRAGDYGVNFSGPLTVDMGKVRERKRAIVHDFVTGTENSITATPGLDLLYGDAKFTGPQSLFVTLRGGGHCELTADKIVINTGARDTVPSIPGLTETPYLTHETIEELDAVPPHLIILGGGYIALEFGQMFRRFGSRVTILEQSPRILSHEDGDISEAMETILGEDGIDVMCAAKVSHVSGNTGAISVAINTPDGAKTLNGTHLLVAVGRTPNTDALDLAKAGVATDNQGHIVVNPKLETSVPHIWAVGDVKGGPQFTHISYDDFRILETNLLHGGLRETTNRPIPYTVFTDPQLGRVGLSEREAREKNLDITVAKLPMTEVARALETDETRGFMKAVIDTNTGQILGFSCLSIDGGEVMAVVQTAMMGHLPYTVLKDGVFAHPTLAESLNNLFMTLD